jgi:predicted DNA-binding transcriptional regulator YafY
MAIYKNAFIRYKVLDRCFSNPGRRYYIEDLIYECEKALREQNSEFQSISLRQIRDDIAFMKSREGWEIELGNFREGKRMYYRYVDPSFSINNMPLNELEINQLQSAISILSQFKGMPQFEWVNEMLPKLKQGLQTEENEQPIIEFDNNQYLTGIEHLGPAYNAILYKKVLKVNYKPFESETAFEVIIHPYFLKQYNNRWFLFGFNPEYDKLDWNLAIDRIVSIKEIKGKYHNNSSIDWQEYFEDVIGVTKPLNAETETVVLQFYGKTGHYIFSKPLHGSQKARWIDKSTLEVRLNVIINYELERLILSYADNVTILTPPKLMSTVSRRLNNAHNQY